MTADWHFVLQNVTVQLGLAIETHCSGVSPLRGLLYWHGGERRAAVLTLGARAARGGRVVLPLLPWHRVLQQPRVPSLLYQMCGICTAWAVLCCWLPLAGHTACDGAAVRVRTEDAATVPAEISENHLNSSRVTRC